MRHGYIYCLYLFLSGISQIITMDLHHKEIHGFFDMTLDNLRASPCLLSYIKEHVSTVFGVWVGGGGGNPC